MLNLLSWSLLHSLIYCAFLSFFTQFLGSGCSFCGFDAPPPQIVALQAYHIQKKNQDKPPPLKKKQKKNAHQTAVEGKEVK